MGAMAEHAFESPFTWPLTGPWTDCHSPLSPSSPMTRAPVPYRLAAPRAECRPVFRVLEGGAGHRARPARYRRRRLAVAVLAALVLLGARTALGQPEGGSPATPGPAPSGPGVGAGAHVHVVEPGDTLWSVARSLQPRGDVRPMVDRLAEARRGAPLRPGERLVVPGDT